MTDHRMKWALTSPAILAVNIGMAVTAALDGSHAAAGLFAGVSVFLGIAILWAIVTAICEAIESRGNDDI